MDFASYLKATASDIEREMEGILGSFRDEFGGMAVALDRLIGVFFDAVAGGKRLRGTLVRLGYEMAGGKYDNRILKVASSFEIFQTAVLTHDDIIDQSSTRRGKPTIYRALGGDHYAVSQAICLGDLGMFLASKLIADSDFPDKMRVQALSVFSRMVVNTALGEMLDVELSLNSKDVREEDVLTIHKLKSSYYTVTSPLLTGLALGGVFDGGVVTDTEKFGENLGVAFQIQDDILGVFGSEKDLGKSVVSDIEEGKATLLISKALDNADSFQRKILSRYYGKRGVGEAGLEQVRKVFVDTGSLDYSESRARHFAGEAKALIPGLSESQDIQKLLSEMADFLINRKY